MPGCLLACLAASLRPTSPVARVAACLRRLVLGLLLAAGSASAAVPWLVLGPERQEIDAWPRLTVLADPGGRLDVEQVLLRRGEFRPPAGKRANLGLNDGAVWLRLQLEVPATDDGRWLLDLDYPPLDRVDAYVVSDGLVVRHALMGDSMPFVQRPLPTRPHALLLILERGLEHELLLRVQTTSAMLLPVRLMKPGAFYAEESRLQMLQGLAAGISLCLVAFALVRAVGRRELVYLHYALSTVGSGLFLFSFAGLGAQHLWTASAWFNDLAPLLSVLVGLAGALWLVDGLFQAHVLSPPLATATRLAGGLAATTALLLAAGVLGYQQAQFVASVLGPLPMIVALPLAARRWRAGDRAAPYVILGWGASAAGATVLALLLHGWLDLEGWTRHAYQVGALAQALAWLRVLDLRDVEQRERAEHAERERLRLQALAHSDALTGLPNRRGLEQALDAALARADDERPLAVFIADLDGFKAVNDEHGHAAGDLLLALVAQRLRAALRQDDLVARLGGDEFVVLADGLGDAQAARQFGERLVDAFAAPFDCDGRRCVIGLTVGFAVAPQDGRDAVVLLRRADAAMYAGKQAGKGRVQGVQGPAMAV
ncbi:diguanylate cyclase [Rubrivivax gelatinosus]|uniref:Diguanylate cyclase (GGDEF)-like protein n=1 Tax=Rubrivivax gelatinosus TaxID=28068 RepID=A0A4R2MFP4_RUBGE|nr:diguanylate cyclase [Rubrivivax gelatinosus]MBK1686743.1 diguanylate cyclase [Rubrivivax gelatinosus]TCP05231.1 diguanylate cyclase (GGDEF)-like protein [Rubrivivax gelatinosus]